MAPGLEKEMRCEDFTVGWICALTCELVAACEMLDREYDFNPVIPNDDNCYTFGKIANLYVVIACLPQGVYGISSAAGVAKDMLRSFKYLEIRLMVGIAGGAPSPKNDIRLGDVVVGCPDSGNSHGGVIQYDHGKAVDDGKFERTGSLNAPPSRVLTILSKLRTKHVRQGNQIIESVKKKLAVIRNFAKNTHIQAQSMTSYMNRAASIRKKLKTGTVIVTAEKQSLGMGRGMWWCITASHPTAGRGIGKLHRLKL